MCGGIQEAGMQYCITEDNPNLPSVDAGSVEPPEERFSALNRCRGLFKTTAKENHPIVINRGNWSIKTLPKLSHIISLQLASAPNCSLYFAFENNTIR